MATVATQLNSGTGFSSGETVTATKLNNLVNTATVTGIVNADIDAAAAIAGSKLADGAVTNAKVNASAAIAYSKLALTNSIVAGDLTSASVTAAKLDGAQTGSAPIYGCRAWVNFDGTVANNLVGTYGRSGNTITVTATAHGFRAGNRADITFAAGTGGTPAASTFEVISVLSANQFTVTDTASGTITGTPAATIKRRLIRAAGNVSSVGYSVVGAYVVNFATELPSANYAVVGSGRYDNAGVDMNVPVVGLFRGQVSGTPVGVGPTDDFCHLSTVNPAAATAGIDCNLVSIAVFG